MTQPKFEPEFFKNNRRRLLESIARDIPVAIAANGLIQRGADSSYGFSQDANFWYLTGINDPDIILVMDSGREFLIVPIREGARVIFDGQIDETRLAGISGVSDIVNEASGWKRLDAILARTSRLATPAPAAPFIEQFGMYSNPARGRFIERLHRHVSELQLFDIRPDMARLRMIKQGPEVEAIKAAVNITVDTLKEVLGRPYGSYGFEYQLEADITRGFRYRGADGHAFEPIVAGGKRACVLHNVTNANILSPGELVVMDVGAGFCGYAADITRVMPTAVPTKRQKEVFSAVKEAHAYALSLLGPGTHLRGYENKVARFVGNKLKQLKVTTNLTQAAIRQYFPHATSHYLGLNVHDAGDYQKPLAPGTVLTVEPGIYLPQEGIGVRIEDDVLITESGIEVLSRGLPIRL